MTTDDGSTVAAPVVKVITAWAAIGITSWADFASAMAALYTVILIGEWCWKKFIKSRFTRRASDKRSS